MSKYTEAEFAACLLECGPHFVPRAYGTNVGEEFGIYYHRLFSWFTRNIRRDKVAPIAKDWSTFYRQYKAWVET